jgi:hypothetical protein
MARRNKMVTGVFRNRVDADRAFDRLLGLGYLESEISVLMSETTRANYYATTNGNWQREGKHTATSHAAEGLAVGATAGTAVGAAAAGSAALAGLTGVLSIGTVVVFPPIGAFTPIIAGPIIAALAGGGAGAVAGGFLGALVGFGIPEQNVRAYEEILREGGVALGVVPHANDDISEIERIFKEHNGENVCTC